MIKYKIGDSFINNKGYKYFLTDRIDSGKKYQIKFEDGSEKLVYVSSILRGEVKYPYEKQYYGEASIGVKYNSTHFLYKRWHTMIGRCYNNKNISYSSYGAKGVTVCERWLCFENYVDDVIKLEGYDEKLIKSKELQLDKDIKNKNTKIYSPETCIWVTPKENRTKRNEKNSKFIAKRIHDGYIEISNNKYEFSKKYNLTEACIYKCINGINESHKGWIFKKYEEECINEKSS